jgi:hypothetical protein
MYVLLKIKTTRLLQSQAGTVCTFVDKYSH